MVWSIPVNGERALVGAAMSVCLLAYPASEARRRKAFKACMAYHARGYLDHYKHDEEFSERLSPLIKSCAPRDMWNCLEMMNKQLLNRLRAAELLAFDGVSQFVEPVRRLAGIYPGELTSVRTLSLKPDGSLAALDTLRVKRPVAPRYEVTEENGARRLQLIDPSRVRPAANSDLLRVGAKRWHMTEHSVASIILAPARLVPHISLALRETLLRQQWPATTDTLDLLACPRWVLPCIEDSRNIADSWADNANLYPAWRRFDPKTFISLRTEPLTTDMHFESNIEYRNPVSIDHVHHSEGELPNELESIS